MVAENLILRYAIIGGSFLVSNLSTHELNNLNQVIIFGSVARNSAAQESDIDIFFDVDMSKKQEILLRSKLYKIAEEFYLTNQALSFKMKSVNNEFSLKVGRLKEWAGLAKSISSEGIVIYGKYTSKPPESKANSVFSWEKPGKSKGAFLNKMYGYKSGKKRYPGLLQKYSGTKLGPATIMVPASSRDIFLSALEKYKVNYSRFDVWT